MRNINKGGRERQGRRKRTDDRDSDKEGREGGKNVRRGEREGDGGGRIVVCLATSLH